MNQMLVSTFRTANYMQTVVVEYNGKSFEFCGTPKECGEFVQEHYFKLNPV